MPLTRVSLALSLPPTHLQATVLEKQAQLKKKQTSFKASAPQRLTFFLDDFHLASAVATRCSVTELVLHLSSHRSLPDLHRSYVHSLSNVRLLSACSLSRGGSVRARVMRRMIPVPFFPPSDEQLYLILHQKLSTWLLHFQVNLTSTVDRTAQVC